MSDYLFSSSPMPRGMLNEALAAIYTDSAPTSVEYHGPWGSIAVTESRYRGFQPYETDGDLTVVIGGPVLEFRNNSFLSTEDSNDGTRAIHHRWRCEKRMIWDQDLNGPFTIIHIDKVENKLTVITDLMGFIPVFSCQRPGELFLGTHVDALAISCGEASNYDFTSVADFVMHGMITYPYTIYQNVRQLSPASKCSFDGEAQLLSNRTYWEPAEANPYSRVRDAARDLRHGVQNYVERITDGMTHVAQFLSGGEDSRALSGMLPQRLERDGYIFLEKMNREGRIAARVADIYGVRLNVGYRRPAHYAEILPEASTLVGGGYQYVHAHSLVFDRISGLSAYSAVFGGYLADTLLKSVTAPVCGNLARYPFLPEISRNGDPQAEPISAPFITEHLLEEVRQRRIVRMKEMKAIRPKSANEWFTLYPASMRASISNISATRRLFSSYEVFLCNEAVKISAAVPTRWKLNRRLFVKAMRPYLRQSKWLPHADGRLPYFAWWVNMPLHFVVWLRRSVAKRLGKDKGYQGPWRDWAVTTSSEEWSDIVQQHANGLDRAPLLRSDERPDELLMTNRLPVLVRVNLLQTAFQLTRQPPEP